MSGVPTIERSVRELDEEVAATREAILATVWSGARPVLAAILDHLVWLDAAAFAAANGRVGARDVASEAIDAAHAVWWVARAALVALDVPEEEALVLLNRHTDAVEAALVAREEVRR